MPKKQDWGTRIERWLEEQLLEMIESQRKGTGFEGPPEDFNATIYENAVSFDRDDMAPINWNSGYIAALCNLAKQAGLKIDPDLISRAEQYIYDA